MMLVSREKGITVIALVFLLCFLLLHDAVTAEETAQPGGEGAAGVVVKKVAPPEEEAPEYDTQLSLGYRFVDHHEYKGKVGEYDPLDSGVDAGFRFSGNYRTNFFDVDARFRANDDQEYSSSMDLSRILKSEVGYSRFIHFLDHNPLQQDSNVVTTDFNPGRDNVIIRSELTSSNRLVIPSLPCIQFKADYRLMTRIGHQQATTVSDCSSCHVMSRSKRINQSTQDIRVGAQVQFGIATFDYTHLEREFREGANAPQADYGPSYGLPVSGVQPYSQVPDSQTRADQISSQFRLPCRSALFASYVNGMNENRDIDKDRDFSNFYASLTSLPWKFLSLRFKFRDYDMDNDVPDALSRDIRMIGFEAVGRFKRWATLKGGYEREDIHRDHFDTGSTEKQTFKTSLLCRPRRTITLNLRYKKEDVDDPFTTPPAEPQLKEETSLPTDTQEWYTDVTWAPHPRLSFLASYRLEDLDNDHLSWYDNRKTILFSIWFSVQERLTVTGTYSYQERDTRTDVTYHSDFLDGADNFTDYDAPYDERTNSYLLNIRYQHNPRLSFTGDFEYTDSKAHFNSTYLTTDVGSFSDLNIQQVRTSFGVNYLLRRDLSLYGRYTFRDYDDHEAGRLDGTAHSIDFGLTWNFVLL